tara:strand:+ start:1243 stop:1875 length:633 start_codon:yes stop_codon:yes gene_type:complete
MISKQIQKKNILAKLLEQGVRLLLIKECRKINIIKIDIFSSSTQIIRGHIQKIIIIAEEINYKDLLLDQVKLEANLLKINFNLKSKELYFKNNPIIKFKISLSQNSLKKVLLSKSWNWISNMISKDILSQKKLDDIKIKDNKFIINTSNNTNTLNEEEKINIKTDKGKILLENKTKNKTFEIPIEDKIYIEDVHIEHNLINIIATSSISL